MLYAAYGSNLHPIRIQQRTPTAQLVGTAKVSNMSLRFHKRGYTDFSGKCNIVESDRASIYVAIYDVSPTEMSLLDKHEGAGSGYDRASINVDRFGACITYIAAATHVDESLLPFSWYRDLVVVGCEKLRFPQHYIERVKAIEVKRDLDCDRHAAYMQLVEECRAW